MAPLISPVAFLLSASWPPLFTKARRLRHYLRSHGVMTGHVGKRRGAFFATPRRAGRAPGRCRAEATGRNVWHGIRCLFLCEERLRVLTKSREGALFCQLSVLAQEYRTIAGGHVDFVIYNKLMPWDHVGGSLIFRRLVVTLQKSDGSPYRPFEFSGGLLAATIQIAGIYSARNQRADR